MVLNIQNQYSWCKFWNLPIIYKNKNIKQLFFTHVCTEIHQICIFIAGPIYYKSSTVWYSSKQGYTQSHSALDSITIWPLTHSAHWTNLATQHIAFSWSVLATSQFKLTHFCSCGVWSFYHTGWRNPSFPDSFIIFLTKRNAKTRCKYLAPQTQWSFLLFMVGAH